VSRTRKQTAAGAIEGGTQPTGKDAGKHAVQTAPAKASKIALGGSLTMLLAWIAFLAVLALGR